MKNFESLKDDFSNQFDVVMAVLDDPPNLPEEKQKSLFGKIKTKIKLNKTPIKQERLCKCGNPKKDNHETFCDDCAKREMAKGRPGYDGR